MGCLKITKFERTYFIDGPLFEAKDSHLGTNLTEVSYSDEDLVRIVSLRRKSNVKVRLKYIISSKRKAKKCFF